MPRLKDSLGILILASVFASAPVGDLRMTDWRQSAFAAEDASEALKKCDALASHPHDPGRYAAGVTDEQFAPGAAIEACEPATRLNPDLARAWFELGRAYWIGQRDSEAFNAFVEAAKRNYAPAMKYIGDAYLLGRGLPAGQLQDGQTALQWYKKSSDAGFTDGTRAFAEAQAYIEKRNEEVEQARRQAEKEKFDPSIFQNSQYMSEIYYNNFKTAQSFQFVNYVKGFIEEMAEKIIFLNEGQKCTTLITGGTSSTVQAEYVASLNQVKLPSVDLTDVTSGRSNRTAAQFAAQINLNHDRGTRDAVALFNRYGCDGAVTLTITTNLNGYFDHTPRNVDPGARDANLPEQAKASPSVPQGNWKFTPNCMTKIRNVSTYPGHVAFATNGPDCESWGASVGRPDLAEARARALRKCAQYGKDCRLVYEK